MNAAPINLGELRERAEYHRAAGRSVGLLSHDVLLALVEAVEAAQAYVHWQDTRRIGPAYLRLTKALAPFADETP